MKLYCMDHTAPSMTTSSSAVDMVTPVEDEKAGMSAKTASRTGAATISAAAGAHCIFCNVRAGKGFHILFEDDELVVFRDIKPASKHHLQVVPKRHIDNVRSLRARDVSLVKKLRTAAHRVLDSLGAPSYAGARRLGFHIPPYISVGHLHLHAHALPFKNAVRGWKYPVRVGNGRTTSKGFSWFVEVDQAVAILERGGKVKIGSC
ncbi:HIT-like protein [Auriculariales sp. MPI-PUGE-AT-0066]|nr:HIT-like protein [Auriculariales sp. MPI-PUGE-AT-0066]